VVCDRREVVEGGEAKADHPFDEGRPRRPMNPFDVAGLNSATA